MWDIISSGWGKVTGATGIFTAITSFFNTIWEFITNLVSNTISFIDSIYKGYNVVVGTITTMPGWLQMFCYWSMALSVIYLVVGRTGKTQ